MQYITFLGTGGGHGYSNLITYFKDDEDSMIETKLVQELIYKTYADKIDRVDVFLTKESKKKYLEELKEKLNGAEIHEILIKQDISTEEFIGKLTEVVVPEEEIILDVTHSFRKIPIRLLFALRYVELLKKMNITHIYYGEVENQDVENERVSLVVDLIKDYEMQKVSEYLSQFERTLILSKEDWDGLINPDNKIQNFLKSLADFSEMIEFIDLNASIQSIKRVCESAASLEKEPEKYAVLLPLTFKIKEKFKKINEKVHRKDKLAELIAVLLKHHHYQLAITFADEIFRTELIRAVYDPNGKMEPKQILIRKLKLREFDKDASTYNCSQYLKAVFLNQKIPDRIKDKFSPFDSQFATNMGSVQKVCDKYNSDLTYFYNDIRNRVNHAQGLHQEARKKLLTTMNTMVAAIQEL